LNAGLIVQHPGLVLFILKCQLIALELIRCLDLDVKVNNLFCGAQS